MRMTVKELKDEIRIEIRCIREALKDLKSEECGIDRWSGIYAETGKYHLKVQYELRYDLLKDFLHKLCQLKRSYK